MSKTRAVAIAVAAMTASLESCHVTTPAQDNFFVDTRPAGPSRLARQLSKDLHTTSQSWVVTPPGTEPAQQYQLDGRGFTIMLVPLPDTRCVSTGGRDTYNNKNYRIDLVYTSLSPPMRDSAKSQLFASIRRSGLRIEPFRKC
jgi:hypothetical protein